MGPTLVVFLTNIPYFLCQNEYTVGWQKKWIDNAWQTLM